MRHETEIFGSDASHQFIRLQLRNALSLPPFHFLFISFLLPCVPTAFLMYFVLYSYIL